MKNTMFSFDFRRIFGLGRLTRNTTDTAVVSTERVPGPKPVVRPFPDYLREETNERWHNATQLCSQAPLCAEAIRRNFEAEHTHHHNVS